MKYLRLLSYASVALAFWLMRHQTTVIPVALTDGVKKGVVRENGRIRAENLKIPESAQFEATTKSGSEIVRIAKSFAESRGIKFTQYSAPRISLRTNRGRLVWSVSYFLLPYVPDGGFTIIVEDKTGIASLEGSP